MPSQSKIVYKPHPTPTPCQKVGNRGNEAAGVVANKGAGAVQRA